jgi:polyisoprenoid-binding protein YceI
MTLHKILLNALLLLLLTFKTGNSQTWNLDATHSNLGFSILHLMISDTKGSVILNSGKIIAENSDFSNAAISIEADMATIDTDNDNRDEHLRSADFFDTKKFPLVTFQSTSILKNDSGKYTITGNLTLHGITRSVMLSATIKSGLNPMDNKPITGCKVTGTIKKNDFGISVSTPEAILSNEVNIEANLEFQKQ